GKLHVQFVRRTEVSARAIERASSDPTAVKPTNKARKAPCGGVCGGGRSGVGGAKGGGQGEYAPAQHVLDSEPGSRVTGAGAYTATCAVTHSRQEKLWGGRRRLWHLHRPYEP